MSNEIENMGQLERAFLNADLGLTDTYVSWFSLPLASMTPEEIQEMVFLHFRAAYLAGQVQGQADIMPMVKQHADAMRELAAKLAAKLGA